MTLSSTVRRHAILCVLSASALYAVVSALIKMMAASYPTAEIVFFRSFVAVAVTLPLLWRRGGLGALRTRRPWPHLARIVTGFSSMATSYYGFATLPLAINTALGFAMPLTLTALSVPMLGERVGWRRFLAISVGLAGVLVVVRPWRHAADALPMFPVAVVMFSVLTWALSMISIRQMGAAGESNLSITLWFSIGCAVLGAIFTVPVWRTPDLLGLCGLVAIGIVSGFAQLVMTEGYRSAAPSVVAPFEYGAILYTTALGIGFWGEYPDIWNIIGILIIIGSGLYIWHRETRVSKPAQGMGGRACAD
jgi:drug/metabolite transporter (DMT)-like permease